MNMKKEMLPLHFYMSSSLVITLFLDNALSHVARMTLQKLVDIEYETFLHLPYSLELSPTNYLLFFPSILDTFFTLKNIPSKGEIETAFKDLLASKPLEIYHTNIDDFVN